MALKNSSDLLSQNASSATVRTAQAALDAHMQRGMQLAVRARFIAIGVLLVLFPILYPQPEVIYWRGSGVVFALIGWAQLRFVRPDRKALELSLLALELVLLTWLIVFPNPLINPDTPDSSQYRFGGNINFFIFLALGTLAYSWRTIRTYAILASMIWAGGVACVWLLSADHPSSALVRDALVGYPIVATAVDPGSLRLDMRLQEIVVFALVAFILSIAVKRYNDLVLTHTAVERERMNLSRYFSPGIVEELSRNDEPFKESREQDVAVLFVDIVGFTSQANGKNPVETLDLLCGFHARMANEVFNHHGTLDKLLGDGLMATFGTPTTSPKDATNALNCASAMVQSIGEWNDARAEQGDEVIRIGIGLHYDPCMLGDIGTDDRLEFAVVGETVNIASRVEAMTRELGVRVLFTDAMREKVIADSTPEHLLVRHSKRFPDQKIRGVSGLLDMFSLEKTEPA